MIMVGEPILTIGASTGTLNFSLPVGDWQARRVSNPQPSVLETDALPIELLAYIRQREL